MPGKKKIRIRVGGIVVNDGKVLLVEHTKGDDKYWLAPGGGVDFCEDFKTALAREFMEELSIDVEVGDLLWVSESISPIGDRHIANMVFMCHYKSGSLKLGNDKRLSGFAYFSDEDLNDIKIFPVFLKSSLSALLRKVDFTKGYMGSNWDR